MKESPEEIATLYVLDQLEPRERALAEARLARDPEFAALVRGCESALAAGIHSLPPRTPSPLVLENLEDQLDELSQAQSPARFPLPASPLPRHPWVTLAQWGIAAVITLSLATLAVQSLRPANAQPVFVVVGLDANRNTFAELPTQDAAAKDPDSRFMQLASAAADLWRNPSARPAAARFDTGGNRGYALFDPGSQQGFLAVEQLPAIAASQRYHLWMIDEPSGRIRDAGILPLAHVNRGLFSFALDPATASKSGRPNFFITIEEAGAPSEPNEKPRGKVVLGKDSI
jgi:anti-sigma-K factor RskA